MVSLRKKHAEKIRFAIVGGVNTAVDFIILLVLTSFGVPPAIANYPSSTAAVVVSFIGNKKYTFRTKGARLKREITLFLVFTFFCTLVLQPLTILLIQFILSPLHLNLVLVAFIAKCFATVVTLVWNYYTYSRFVFIDNKPSA